MKNNFKILLLISIILLTLNACFAEKNTITAVEEDFRFITGTDCYPYNNLPLPEKGEILRDENFNTAIVRITDKKTDCYTGPGIQNEYSRTDPENCDGTLLILRGNDGSWYLYERENFKMLKHITVFNECNQEPEPRWDHINGKIFYYVCNTELRSYNTDNDTSSLIHDFKKDFPEASFIRTKTEGEPSMDRRYWSFMVEDEDYNLLSVIVFDKTENKIIGKKDNGFPDSINWVSMDMSGSRCIIGYESILYCQVFKRDFSGVLDLPEGSNAHGDFALTEDGRDVLVYQNIRTDYISMADLEKGEETQLLEIPFSVNSDIGLHFSGNCSETPGWVLVSTYGAKNTPPEKSHSWMDCQLFMVELRNKPSVWRIGHTHSFTSLEADDEKNYFAESFAAINRKGTEVYFGSNYSDFTPDYSETYMVILPERWRDGIK